MGKIKSNARKYYNVVQEKNKKDKYVCKYCKNTDYVLNATRLARHLVKCSKCPKAIQDSFRSEPCAASETNSRPRPRPTGYTALDRLFRNDVVDDEDEIDHVTEDLEEETRFASRPSTIISIDGDDDNDRFSFSSTSNNMSAATRPSGPSPSSRTSKTSRPNSSLDRFMDTVNPQQQSEIWEALARAIYASNSPLAMFEDPLWIDAFKIIRPSLTLPSRYHLSTPLLNQEFGRVDMSIKEKVGEACTLGLQCDGWSNLRNEPIVTFVLTTPAPVVYKTISTTIARHTGEYMAEVMSDVIDENGAHKFLGIVTDNAKNMRKAWDILERQYKAYPIAFYGCIAHILNLLINDILKLNTCSALQAQCKDIIKNIQGSHVLNAIFVKIQKDKHKTSISLKLPVATRWGSIITCFKSLLATKYALQALAISEEANSTIDRGVKNRLLDNDVFWVRVEKTADLLGPLLKWITVLEADTPRLSIVPHMFVEIKEHIIRMLPESPFSRAEEKQILAAVEKRRQFALRPVHYAANILDPAYMGKSLSPEEDVDGISHLYKVALSMLEHKTGEIMADLARYRSKEGLWAKDFVWDCLMQSKPSTSSAEQSIVINASTWWKGICGSSPLSKVAVAILTLPASSAATERSFSTYGFVHTKKRNRLTTKRAGMLMYISHNLKLNRRCGSGMKSDMDVALPSFFDVPDPAEQSEVTDDDDDDVVSTYSSDSSTADAVQDELELHV